MIQTSSRSRFWVAGALVALFAVGSPAFAEGGGHGHGGGGGSMGGHFGGQGGGGGHFAGHSFAGGRPGGSFGGGAHAYYAPRGNFGVAGGRGGYAPRGNYVASAGFHGGIGRPGISNSAFGRPGFGRPGFGHPGFGRPGFGHGGYGRSWGGGYWHGGFWPGVSYGWGFPLFLPLLPAIYSTYWWGGVPYYYANDVYYTYNPDQNGYAVTDPPPVSGSAQNESGADNSQPAPSSDVYAYPQNGQTEEQQANDKYECHNWARSQTGFDPTHVSGSSSGNPADYQRAMTACLNGRGYSAQ